MVFRELNKVKIALFLWFFLSAIVSGVFFLGSSAVVFAQAEEVDVVCPVYTIELVWDSDVKLSAEYRFMIESDIPLSEVWSIEQEVRLKDQVLATYPNDQFTHTFEEISPYLIKSIVRTKDGCMYVAQQSIAVYDRLFTYVGTDPEEFDFVRWSFQETGFLLKEILVPEEIVFNDEALLQTLLVSRSYLQHADVLFLEGQILPWFLSIVPRIQQFTPLDFSETRIYILANISYSTFRRLFATYRDLAGIDEIGVLPKQYIGSLLNILLVDKDPMTLDVVEMYSLSVEQPRQRAVVSYLVDYLLYNNVPLSFVIMLLLLPVLVVIAAFFRQVVGFSVYGVFNPLLVAFSLHFIGIVPTFFFFLVSFLATLLVNVFVKRVYLLYSAKVALVIVVYTILLLSWLTILQKYDIPLFDLQPFSNLYILFPIVFLTTVTYSIFKEKTTFLSASLRKGFLQFVIVSVLMYLVIRRNRLHNVLLGYPELILFFLLGTILIGRFTWLQLTEYVRFLPLIRRYGGDHEEEDE